MDWVRRVGALMVLAALAGQARAAVPGQQGAGSAAMPGAKTGGPVYRVVHNNHDIKVLLRQFWDQDLRKPSRFNTDIVGASWVHGCLSPHHIVRIPKEPNKQPLVLFKIKLVRIVLRKSNIVSQIAKIKPYLGLKQESIGYFIVSMQALDLMHNDFWKNIHLGQYPKYFALQIYARSNDHSDPRIVPRRFHILSLFHIRVKHTNFTGYIYNFLAFYSANDNFIVDLERHPPLPDATLYRTIGQSAGFGPLSIALRRDSGPNYIVSNGHDIPYFPCPFPPKK